MSRLLPGHKNRCWVNTLGGEIQRRWWFCQIKDHTNTKRSSAPSEGLKAWTKMDFTIYSFKRESPLKHSQLQILPPPHPHKKKQCWRPAGLLWGGVGGGVIGIPNPRDKRPVGKKVRNSKHSLPNSVAVYRAKAIPFFQVIWRTRALELHVTSSCVEQGSSN